MKDFNPKQDIFNLLKINKDFSVTDESVDEIRVSVSETITEDILEYFEQFVNHIRKSAYSMSEDKYIGFNLACDNIIQQLNLSYIDYDINCNKDDENKK